MPMEKKLYPLKFVPQVFEKDWGLESLLLADLGEAESEVADGWLAGNGLSDLMQTYLERLAGETSFDYYGLQFPVALRRKEIRKGRRTSLWMNPDDETAEQRYDCFGRTVLWFVEEADAEATLWLGFRKEVAADEFYRRCLDGSLEEILHAVKPRKGDAFLIPPGTVYGARGYLKLVEVSESSDLFFRIHDWGAGKEIHLEEAFDLIRFGPWDHAACFHRSEGGKDVTELLAECPQMAVTLFRVAEPVHIVQAEEADSFFLYHCLSGGALLQVPGGGQYRVGAGECVLVPDEVEDFFIVPDGSGTRLLEVLLPARQETDGYTGDPANVEPLEE